MRREKERWWKEEEDKRGRKEKLRSERKVEGGKKERRESEIVMGECEKRFSNVRNLEF